MRRTLLGAVCDVNKFKYYKTVAGLESCFNRVIYFWCYKLSGAYYRFTSCFELLCSFDFYAVATVIKEASSDSSPAKICDYKQIKREESRLSDNACGVIIERIFTMRF
jgi:hypothetical protein